MFVFYDMGLGEGEACKESQADTRKPLEISVKDKRSASAAAA